MRRDGAECSVIVEQQRQDGLVSNIFTEILLEVLHLNWLHLGGQQFLSCNVTNLGLNLYF